MTPNENNPAGIVSAAYIFVANVLNAAKPSLHADIAGTAIGVINAKCAVHVGVDVLKVIAIAIWPVLVVRNVQKKKGGDPNIMTAIRVVTR